MYCFNLVSYVCLTRVSFGIKFLIMSTMRSRHIMLFHVNLNTSTKYSFNLLSLSSAYIISIQDHCKSFEGCDPWIYCSYQCNLTLFYVPPRLRCRGHFLYIVIRYSENNNFVNNYMRQCVLK